MKANMINMSAFFDTARVLVLGFILVKIQKNDIL